MAKNQTESVLDCPALSWGTRLKIPALLTPITATEEKLLSPALPGYMKRKRDRNFRSQDQETVARCFYNLVDSI